MSSGRAACSVFSRANHQNQSNLFQVGNVDGMSPGLHWGCRQAASTCSPSAGNIPGHLAMHAWVHYLFSELINDMSYVGVHAIMPCTMTISATHSTYIIFNSCSHTGPFLYTLICTIHLWNLFSLKQLSICKSSLQILLMEVTNLPCLSNPVKSKI
jgi:hypothetical protein